MSSAPHVERFKGTGWEECDDFISAIRARALWEGKQRDSAWIADFAAPLFTRKALSWHCRLPQDVRQDWFKLEVALVDRWPPPEDDDDDPQIRPTPAAAPPANHRDEPDRTIQGILKIVLDEEDTTYYVQMPGTLCDLTSNASEAIRVRLNSVSRAAMLERIDGSSHSWIAAGWTSQNAKIERGSTDYAYMPTVNPDTLEPSWKGEGTVQPTRFIVMANGEVVPIWVKDDTSKITLSVFVTGTSIYLAADAEAYAQKYSAEKRGRFFIESTD